MLPNCAVFVNKEKYLTIRYTTEFVCDALFTRT
jgi:hypothetical protein